MPPKRSGLDWLLEAISLAAVAVTFVITASHWAELPAQVPLHFGASGAPNGWGDKNGLWILPFVSMFLYIVLTAASRYQRLINVPFRIERDAPEVQQLLLNMSIVLKAAMTLMFAYLTWASMNAALGRSEGLGRDVLPVSLLVIFSPMIWYLLKLWRYRSP